MEELQRLFGEPIAYEEIVDCRVRRLASRGVATAIVLGMRPTWLTLTLRDGRRLEKSSPGSGPDQITLNVAIDRIARRKTEDTLAALARGKTVAFGSIELSPSGISLRGQLTRWEHITGWAVRSGGFLYDDREGRLAGEVMLAAIPFPDALVETVASRLPSKDYEKMSRGDGPKHGFYSITARTRIPGTFKYQIRLFFGVIPALLLLIPIVLITVNRVRYQFLRATYVEAPPDLRRIDEAAAALAGEPVAPACDRTLLGDEMLLASTDKATLERYHDRRWSGAQPKDVARAPRLYVWTVRGSEVRVVLWDADRSKPLCFAKGESAETALRGAELLVESAGDNPAPSASAPPPPSAAASAAPSTSASARPKRPRHRR